MNGRALSRDMNTCRTVTPKMNEEQAATRTHQQDNGELHQALQVCVFISSPTKRLFSESPSYYRRRQRSERWEMAVVLVEMA